MATIHIERADRAGPGVQVLERAPKGKIDAPVIKSVRYDPDGMGTIESNKNAAIVSGLSQSLDVQELARAIEHRRQNDQRDLAGHRIDHVILRVGAAVSTGNKHQIGLFIPAGERDLALQRIDV